MRTGSSGTQRVTTVHTCLVDHAGLYDGGEHHGLLAAVPFASASLPTLHRTKTPTVQAG
jgi:hypothetical protein